MLPVLDPGPCIPGPYEETRRLCHKHVERHGITAYVAQTLLLPTEEKEEGRIHHCSDIELKMKMVKSTCRGNL